jgi:TolB-like protein
MVAYPRKGATLPAHTFLAELKRRKVFRAGAIYIASAFVVLQAADLLLPALHLPAWLMTLTVVVALLGLPLTLVLAWAFDVVPGTATVDDAAGVQTTGRASGVRWVVALFALVVLVTAGRFAWQRIVNPQESISTIAVLPFVNIGGVASDDYFSDGMTDELAHALIHLPGLRVAGRSSSYTFKGKEATAQAVGAALGVGALITGTVRRAGDRLRVTTQLVSTADGKILWDGQYETRSNDVFFVQDQFTREIISALSPTLTTQVADTLAGRVRGTRDQEAYELYLKGNLLLGRAWQG